jgi:hypothetical protein
MAQVRPIRGPASRSLHPARDSAMALAPSSSFETGLIPAIILLSASASIRLPVSEQGRQGCPHAEPDVVVEMR